MKTNFEKLEGLSRKINIEIPAEKVNEAYTRVYKGIQKNANIKGFRPGKAPMATIRQLYKEKVTKDVIDQLFSEAYSKALDEHTLDPIGYPKINFDSISEDKEFKFSAEFEVRPEVHLSAYEGLEVEKEKLTIDETKIDQVIENIRASQGDYVPVFEDRPVASGDYVDIDFAGLVNGAPLEGGSAQGHILEIGSNQFIPGFEQALIGMAVGTEKTVDLSFPKDYHVAELAGQPVSFKTKLNHIKKKSLPEINDELAKKTGEFETLNELKDAIKKDMEASEVKRIQDELKNHILKALVEKNPVEAPQSLVGQQKEMLITDTQSKMKQQGMSDQEFEEYRKKWDNDFADSAKFMVKSTFLIDALAKKLNLDATNQDVDKKIDEYAKQSGIELNKIKEFYSEEEKKSRLRFQITEEKVIQHLIEKAKVKEVNPRSEKA